jgi:hypothetical protein
MDVQVIREEFADCGPLAGLVNRCRIPGLEQQRV